MTICASVKVRDGLVLGTDSMTQIMGRDQQGRVGPIKSYSNARKLYNIRGCPVGVMTYGIGNLGPHSIQGLIREFCDTEFESTSVKSISENLFVFPWVVCGMKPKFEDIAALISVPCRVASCRD